MNGENEELMYLLAALQGALLRSVGFKNLERAAELFNDAMGEDLPDDIEHAAAELATLAAKLHEKHPNL